MSTGHPLDPLFHPGSIAVIGASSDPRKIGGRPIAYMVRSGFAGGLYPINPKQPEIQGLRAYPSLAAIGHPVDQVIVAVAGDGVLPAIDEAIAARARSVVVFSAGFGEISEAGRAQQEQMAERCRAAGVQFVGPNCIGVFSAQRAVYATFMSALEHEMHPAGRVGIVSQSGAIGSYLYDLAGERGLRFSHFVATGNEAGVDVADCIAWMAQDAGTSVIMAYLEGCRDGDRLRRALQAARAQRKPVIVMKVGASEQGAAAAASHTGSLAGADAIYDAVLRETNAWRARTMEEMVDIAYACATAPLPRGNRLGVITPSGGVGVIAADEAERCGLVLPPLPVATQAEIRRIVPYASGVNPVDTTGQVVSDRQLFVRIMKLVFEHDGFDSILSFNATIGKSEIEWAKVRDDLYALRRAHPERFVALSMGASPQVVAELAANGIAWFADPARATATLGALARISAGFDAPAVDAPSTADTGPFAADLAEGPLDEAAARRMLQACGIPFAPQHIATTADEAAAAADAIGGPVVMKIVSTDIAHKSDVGGVVLDLPDAQAVRAAWPAMMATVRQRAPKARIAGAMLSPMIRGGVETVMGVVRDPVFGPMVMFGLGGVFVEVFEDVTFRSAPLDMTAARQMIGSVRAWPLLQGARGRPAVDIEAIARALVALSRFAARHAGAETDRIESIEINPFIALERGGWGVDALIAKRGTDDCSKD